MALAERRCGSPEIAILATAVLGHVGPISSWEGVYQKIWFVGQIIQQSQEGIEDITWKIAR